MVLYRPQDKDMPASRDQISPGSGIQIGRTQRCPNKVFGAIKGPCPHPLPDQRLNVGARDFDGHDCGPPLSTVTDVGLSVTKFKTYKAQSFERGA